MSLTPDLLILAGLRTNHRTHRPEEAAGIYWHAQPSKVGAQQPQWLCHHDSPLLLLASAQLLSLSDGALLQLPLLHVHAFFCHVTPAFH